MSEAEPPRDPPPAADRPPRGGWRDWLADFWAFGLKEAWASLFGGLLLAAILVTAWLWPGEAAVWGLYRYDWLLLFAVAVQVAMLATGLEEPREAAVIAVFHVVATVMEVFKTAVGSWAYPEPAVFRITAFGGSVPLFAGFMYSAVGSYIARAWRVLEFRFTGYPPLWKAGLLAAAIYANFFTHHYAVDLRWPLVAMSLVVFGRCTVWFRPGRRYRRMPQPVANLLVALFIWVAENAATFARVWVYPNQRGGWQMVKLDKLVAWYLLMLLSGFLVTLVHRPREAAAD